MDSKESKRTCVITKLNLEPNHRKYKCCCGSVQSTTGALIVGSIHLLMAITAMSALIHARPFLAVKGLHDVGVAVEVIGAVFICLGLLVTLLLILGIVKKNCYLLIPYITYQIFNIILDVIGGIGLIVATLLLATTKHGAVSNDEIRNWAILGWTLGILIMLSSTIECWFLTIVLSAYHYLRDMAMIQKEPVLMTVNFQGLSEPLSIRSVPPNITAPPPTYSSFRKSENTI